LRLRLMPRPVETRIHPTPFISNAMKIRIRTGFAAALCLMLASCYPYPENPQQRKANQAAQRQTAAEQAKLKEQEALKKQQDELKKSQETPGETIQPGTTDPTTPPPPQPPVEQKRADYPFANKVPGKEGFVFSPYNNKVVDVREIPSGTLVQDPTYPASEKKYFRVP
jgi:uncharacterized protein with von Willebrand factor type A (vWA) domain